jgi:hypothetical protein
MEISRSMFRSALLGLAALAGLVSFAHAEPLGLPSGLSVDPPGELDLTYQIVHSYDEHEKVIVGWDGDKLQYFISIQKLPPDYLNADVYLAGFARDLESAWGSLDIGRRTTYPAKGGLKGTVVAYSSIAGATDKATHRLIVHFLTDGAVSYIAEASLVPAASFDEVFDYTVELLQTARVESGVEPTGHAYSEESPFFGTWVCDETDPSGRSSVARLELKDDLSFATEVRVDSKVVFAAAGTWTKDGNKLHWIYTSSQPPLPAKNREDDDEIISADRTIVVLKSFLTGKTHVYQRDSKSGN